MTRILYVIKNLQQGGTEGQLLRLWDALPARFEKTLCLMAPEIHYDHAPAHVMATDVAALAARIDETRPDVIHSFRDQVNHCVWLALRQTKHQPAWLFSVRGRPIKPKDLWRTRRMCGRAHAVTVNSEGVAATLRRVGVPNVVVTPNLIDLERFRGATPKDRQAARAALGLGDDDFAWVLPARISWVKNQLGLAAAVALLRRPMVVLLPGRARDAFPAWLLPRWARLLGVGDKLRMLGMMKDLTPIYAAADALVLPSWAEGMPNVALEAHLAALPIVVSHEANRDTIVSHGETGFVTGPLPVSLAGGMRSLMDAPSAERVAMGTRGRARVRERFDRQALLAQLVTLYEDSLRRS